MNYELFENSDKDEVIQLFTNVFSASEGKEEGQVIGNLVSNLIHDTDQDDLIGCIAKENEIVQGGIFFSRFTVPDDQAAFILSPVAIATKNQGSGIGQQLIHYGLNHLKSINVNLVFTYGDPAYYSKTGFQQINENVIQAPYPLSQPVGWLAQSLNGKPIKTMSGSTRCVAALSNADYW
jgi:putative acetyltransferase